MAFAIDFDELASTVAMLSSERRLGHIVSDLRSRGVEEEFKDAGDDDAAAVAKINPSVNDGGGAKQDDLLPNGSALHANDGLSDDDVNADSPDGDDDDVNADSPDGDAWLDDLLG